MSLADLINIQISASAVLPGQAGFGVPVIAGFHTKYPDMVRYYSSLAGLAADGFPVTGSIYLAAATIMAQSPNVTQFGVGRRTTVDTQVLNLTLTSTSALDTYTCTFVDGVGVAKTLSVPSTGVPATDATTVGAAITAMGLAGCTVSVAGAVVTLTHGAKIGAVTTVGSGPAVTFTGTPTADDLILITVTLGGTVGVATFSWSKNGGAPTTGVVTASTVLLADGVTANFAAGTYVLGTTYTVQAVRSGVTTDIQNWAPNANTPILQLSDTTADPGLATDLANILAADNTWYGLCLAHNAPNLVKTAMAFVESNSKIGAFNCSDTAIELGTAGNIALATQALGYSRSCGIYSRSAIKSFAGAAALGRDLPPAPGSITWAYKNLTGVAADKLNQTASNNIVAASWNYFTTFKGSRVMIPGWSPAGEFMDIVQGIDWFQDLLQTDLFALFVGASKVPFTDAGGDQVLSVIKADLQRAVQQKFANPGDDITPAPSAFVPKVATISASNRALRKFIGSTFAFNLAGAIQTLTLTGTVVP